MSSSMCLKNIIGEESKKTVETREWGRTVQVFLFWVRNGYNSQWHTAEAPIFPGHMHTPKDDGEGLMR